MGCGAARGGGVLAEGDVDREEEPRRWTGVAAEAGVGVYAAPARGGLLLSASRRWVAGRHAVMTTSAEAICGSGIAVEEALQQGPGRGQGAGAAPLGGGDVAEADVDRVFSPLCWWVKGNFLVASVMIFFQFWHRRAEGSGWCGGHPCAGDRIRW